MNKISAVIAARANSRRVKNKNIRPFAGSSLLERKLLQLKGIKEIDAIYVNSDSNKILKIAKKYNVNTIKRDRKYALSSSKINDVYVNVVKPVVSEHILFIHITSPFVKTSSIRKCIKKYFSLQRKYDSLATVTKFKKFLWHKSKPQNYKISKMPRSQDLPNYYYLNFAVNIMPKELILKKKNIIGNKFYPYFLNDIESFDIDTMDEFNTAEKIIQ